MKKFKMSEKDRKIELTYVNYLLAFLDKYKKTVKKGTVTITNLNSNIETLHFGSQKQFIKILKEVEKGNIHLTKRIEL